MSGGFPVPEGRRRKSGEPGRCDVPANCHFGDGGRVGGEGTAKKTNDQGSFPRNCSNDDSRNYKHTRVVVKIMVPFWAPIILRHHFLGCPNRDLNSDNYPHDFENLNPEI